MVKKELSSLCALTVEKCILSRQSLGTAPVLARPGMGLLTHQAWHGPTHTLQAWHGPIHTLGLAWAYLHTGPGMCLLIHQDCYGLTYIHSMAQAQSHTRPGMGLLKNQNIHGPTEFREGHRTHKVWYGSTHTHS